MRFFVLFLIISISSLIAEDKRPNVIIFIADDISWDDYSCYGNKTIQTPHIDALAKNGTLFEQAFLTASSCSPSRASIITGRYPHNNGEAQYLHKKIPENLPWIPEVLAETGYYTVLSGKNHMTRNGDQAKPLFEVIDNSKVKGGESGGHALWTHHVKNRDKSRPFFFWFASNDAHRAWESRKKWNTKLLGPQVDPADVIVPEYYVDDERTRQDLAWYFDEVRRFDFFIGETVKALKEEGILDNTLLLVLADNGRPFPRAKTRLHDSGMKTGLVAHWPKGIQGKSNKVKSLVSVIDLAPTILEAAGVKVGASFQGVSLLPLFENPKNKVRDYVFSEHNWHDFEALGRSVRYGDFLYIENHRTQFPQQGPADAVRSDTYQSLLEGQEKGTLTPPQADTFLAPRSQYELYMNSKDQLQMNNLAGKPEYQQIEKELKAVLQRWSKETGDTYPEKIMPDRFHRITGKVMPEFDSTTPYWSYSGESTQSHKIHAKGPILK